MWELDFSQKLFILIPKSDHPGAITSHQKIDEFVEITACQPTVVFPLFLTLNIEQRVIISVEFEQLRLSRLEHHQESVVVGRSLGLVKHTYEIDVTVQSKSVKDFVLLLFIVDSPYFEVPLDAKCYEHFCLWQVFDHLNSLTVDREPTVNVVQFLNMNQDETPFGHS